MLKQLTARKPGRWPVERAIARLKQYRAVGIRRDRNPTIYQAFVQLACGLIAYKKIIA